MGKIWLFLQTHMEAPFREGEFEAAVGPSKNGVNSSKMGIEWNQRIGWIDVSFE